MTAAPDGGHRSRSSALNDGAINSFYLSAKICTLKNIINFTLCSLLLRLKVLLQLRDRVLQTELIILPVSSLGRKQLHQEKKTIIAARSTGPEQNIILKEQWMKTCSFWEHSCDITDICSSSFEIWCNSLMFFTSASFSCVWTLFACS